MGIYVGKPAFYFCVESQYSVKSISTTTAIQASYCRNEGVIMPTTKHKRKSTAHSHNNTKSFKAPGLIASYPKRFILLGSLFIALAIYLLAFESQNNSMFGLAMISLITGVVTIISANFAVSKKKRG